MVAVTDLKWYNSQSGLGGAISATQLTTATPNNFFTNVPKNELVVGAEYYGCVYLKNTGAEDMKKFKLWLSNKSPSGTTAFKWGYDPVVFQTSGSGYRWSPSFDADGASYDDTASTADLQLNHHSVCAWFKTSTDFTTDAMIVNKGGIGSDSAGENMSYGLWMNSSEQVKCGFEEGAGTDHFITSPLSYNDGLWHFAVATYDGVNLKLYIDDMITPVSSAAVTQTPEVNTKPVRVGANSRATDRYFTGEIDEVRIYSSAITEATRVALLDNIVSQTGLKLEKKFGTDDNILIAQTIANDNTAPLDVEWLSVTTEPDESVVGDLQDGAAFPIWLWRHIDANATARLNDNATFTFNFQVPTGGTGSGGSGGSGGGSGGNPPPTPTDYKIAFAADWGNTNDTDDVLDLIADQDYDFVVGAGDNAYDDSSASSWCSKFDVLMPNFNSAYGNHEYEESGGISPYKTFFSHSKTYFSFKFQNILFLVIDTNINCDPGSTQHNVIKAAVEASDPTVTWKIAVMHHPWFGSASNHSYDEFQQVEAFHELFQNNGVNFVICAHNHNWQRTAQVQYNNSDPEDPTVIDNTSPYVRTAHGIIHVVTGAGGHDSGSSLYDLDDAIGASGNPNLYQNRSKNGVWEIVASNSGNTLTCSFVDISGAKFDTFTIS